MAPDKRVYLLLGPEVGQKGERLKTIRATLDKQFGAPVEVHRFYPFETLDGEIITTLQNNSLFSDHRLVILSQAEDLLSSQVDDLVTYLKAPSDTATLIIISSENNINPKITALVPKEQTTIFWEMFENRKADWLLERFRRGKCSITSEAIDFILEMVENNTQELGLIAEQLIAFAQTENISPLDSEKIEVFIEHTRQVSAFDLFAPVAKGDYKRGVETLHYLFNDPQNHPISILATLTWQFRRLLSLGELVEAGLPFNKACQKASVMGKSSPIKRRKDIELYQEALRRYPPKACHTIIARIGECDLLLREMGSDPQLLLLELLLGTIILKKGQKRAKFPFVSLLKDAKF